MKVKHIQTKAAHGKRLFSGDASSFASLIHLIPIAQHFGLLLACDARGLSAETISNVAKTMYERGLCYLCAWGADCERVHDIFDETQVEMNIEAMTTWHADEPIEDAVWFFISCAIPDERSGSKDVSDVDWIAVSIANQDWLQKIELALIDSRI